MITSVPSVVPGSAGFRVDRVFRLTSEIFLRNYPMFIAVSAVADLPRLLVHTTHLFADALGSAWTLFDVFVFLVTSTLAEAVVLQAAFDDMRGERPALVKSVRVALGRGWPLIGLAIFMAFA